MPVYVMRASAMATVRSQLPQKPRAACVLSLNVCISGEGKMGLGHKAGRWLLQILKQFMLISKKELKGLRTPSYKGLCVGKWRRESPPFIINFYY